MVAQVQFLDGAVLFVGNQVAMDAGCCCQAEPECAYCTLDQPDQYTVTFTDIDGHPELAALEGVPKVLSPVEGSPCTYTTGEFTTGYQQYGCDAQLHDIEYHVTLTITAAGTFDLELGVLYPPEYCGEHYLAFHATGSFNPSGDCTAPVSPLTNDDGYAAPDGSAAIVAG
ncbi:MAG TPA: hypothetical protein VMY35_06470 [Phycisphaerae bacterium]|nr:hypothetical protein [Phycisphaerae bacterium]